MLYIEYFDQEKSLPGVILCYAGVKHSILMSFLISVRPLVRLKNFIRIESFESYADLACEFVNRKATFHKSCIIMYDKQKLNRKRKRNDCWEAEQSNDRQNTTRRSLSAKNFTDKCFFCDTANLCEELHTCQTLYLDMRIRNIAQEMNNAKLLIKLSEGDMVATEAKYHRGCLIMLYNSYRLSIITKR